MNSTAEDFSVTIADATLMVQRISLSPGEPRASIIFLHDSLGSIKLWRHFPAELARATKCDAVIYERQGYGGSSPFSKPRSQSYLEEEGETLLRLIEILKLPRTILFGHSDGGSIALFAAALAPEKIAAVITEGAHVFVEEITLEGIRQAEKDYLERDLAVRLRKYHGDNTQGVFDAWVKTWLSPEFRSWNMQAVLPKVRCPVLVIQGENDEFGTSKQVDTIVENVSGIAEKFMVPDVSHTPHRDAASSVLQCCSMFISQVLES
ncbi:MAG: alpha/beta hydrolase [Candidatus Obscuribacterales bacterium]|nr:alpha/beta hydrolase [Candidatus Obscuribacterales bacterium]